MRLVSARLALAVSLTLSTLGGPVLTAQDAEPAAPAVDSQQARTDAEIAADLQAVFERVPEFNGVQVEVDAGVVRLGGRVLEPEAEEQAVELARTFDGVRYVSSRIQTSTSLDERLRPTWARLRDFFVDGLARLPLFLVAFLIVGVAWALGRWVSKWRLPEWITSRNPLLQNLVSRVAQATVVIAGLALALDLVDAVAIAGALAGTAGLAGLAVGFAFKDIVENYLAGILLSLRHPFATNDHVILDGHEGKVVRLTWRDTILMTLEGNHLRVPNGRVFGSVILNFTRNPRRRFSFDFGVGPADDVLEAQRVGIDTLAGMRSVLHEPAPQALVRELGDSSVQVRFLGWVDQRQADLSRVRSEAIRLVKMALEEAGVSLPSPEYRVVLDGEATPPGSATPARDRPVEQDTSVDDALDQQIDEDRAVSEEEDLLTASAP